MLNFAKLANRKAAVYNLHNQHGFKLFLDVVVVVQEHLDNSNIHGWVAPCCCSSDFGTQTFYFVFFVLYGYLNLCF